MKLPIRESMGSLDARVLFRCRIDRGNIAMATVPEVHNVGWYCVLWMGWYSAGPRRSRRLSVVGRCTGGVEYRKVVDDIQ